ncbi:MAG: ABC transporter substrate-binding protein [Candidatus Devosia symbiotica]|nr:ABC transporter substrate-binding protein [Candidatus Devosia symbiotica]
MLDKFSAKTGIKANVLYAGDGLLERVATEGELPPSDVVLTVDIGNLVGAEELGLTRPIAAPELNARVPAEFRDDEDNWAALSLRARVFYVSRDRGDAPALTYEDIIKPEWKGRVCIRPGDPAYNIGLIAQRIAANSLDDTRTCLA